MMEDYSNLVKRLAQINEGASIIALDVSASSNDQQQVKSALIGITFSSGAMASMTIQAPCYETLIEALETVFTVQGQIVEQAIDQVNVMISTDEAGGAMGALGGAQGDEFGDDTLGDPTFSLGIDGGEEAAGLDIDDGGLGGELGADEISPEEAEGDVVIDTDEIEPEIGDDLDAKESRYKYGYSFRNKGTGLFQSLTGQQRISKAALKAARTRLGK